MNDSKAFELPPATWGDELADYGWRCIEAYKASQAQPDGYIDRFGVHYPQRVPGLELQPFRYIYPDNVTRITAAPLAQIDREPAEVLVSDLQQAQEQATVWERADLEAEGWTDAEIAAKRHEVYSRLGKARAALLTKLTEGR